METKRAKITPESLRREVRFSAVRSRGPGGQNVNKVASAAQVYWNPSISRLLSGAEKERLLPKVSNLLNATDEIFLRSDEFRDLERNKNRCLEKLALIINQRLHIPKTRQKTQPTRAAKERRREAKAKRSAIKRTRRSVGSGD